MVMLRQKGLPVRLHVWGHTHLDADAAEDDARREAARLDRPVAAVVRVVGGRASAARAQASARHVLRCDRCYDREYLIVADCSAAASDGLADRLTFADWIGGRWR